MDRFWPVYLMTCEGPWSHMHFEAQDSADLASLLSHTLPKKEQQEDLLSNIVSC